MLCLTIQNHKLQLSVKFAASQIILLWNAMNVSITPTNLIRYLNNLLLSPWDRESREVIAAGTRLDDLYVLQPKHVDTLKSHAQAFFSNRFRVVSSSVWHMRLGHPQASVVQFLEKIMSFTVPINQFAQSSISIDISEPQLSSLSQALSLPILPPYATSQPDANVQQRELLPQPVPLPETQIAPQPAQQRELLPQPVPLPETQIATQPASIPTPATVSCSTTRMQTRSQLGIVKPNPKYFMSTVSVPSEPKSVKEALVHPGWKKAMAEEMTALHQNQTWTLVPSQRVNA
ncbi:hypothetical protein COLO4_38093 [Corchorus olitorius]|uniref:GAG-pre-integrase domain-containing protein n=1 Tax=Corchorus olitorius TaxID=93759 RepID=A0A1R3FXB8_9ROSI|nr:hypothetical protein COLO4_38093 [Corchorus olitorius]